MASSPQSEKETFFARLDHLDELAFEEKEEEEDQFTINFAQNHKRLHASAPLVHEPYSSQSNVPGSKIELPSTSTTTALASPTLSSLETMGGHNPSPKSRATKAPSKLSKKQNRGKFLQLQPGDAQIFRGLTLYFVPNNTIAAARKKRIEKAQEYGGTWAKEWSSAVTHVIVDAGLELSDVRKAIGPGKLKSSHIIVNETYLPDCVKFRVLLPIHLIKFQVACGSSPVGAEQHALANNEDLVSEALGMTVESDVVNALEHGEGNDEPAAVRGETISSCAAGSTDIRSDELDITMVEVRELAHLPLDSDDESSEPPPHGTLSDSDDFQPKRQHGKRLMILPPNSIDTKRHFSCMRKNEGMRKATNPNWRTIETLDQMAQYYDRTGDHWRTLAYRKCITALKGQLEHITTREQAMRISGIGERLAVKVEEIALTNSLKRLESTISETTDQLLQLFMGIYQVGLPTAARWIAQGHKSLQDLKSKADLTTNHRIGIDHYDDFLARIPRREVMAHGDLVRRACTEADAGIQVLPGGSYRRGAVDSGDIDLIITKDGASLENIRTILTDTVIPQLFQEGFLKVRLAGSNAKSQDHGSKWHGASALPGSDVWRRLDLLFVPWNELGAALIYFTGNDIFNRSIRLLASRKKMRLNQHGLFQDVMRGEKRQRVTQGKLLEAGSEERIFEILGVPWRPPQHRIC